MRLSSLLCALAIALAAALTACQSETIVVMVVTATPTSEVAPTALSTQLPPPTLTTPDPQPTHSAVPTIQPTLNPFPTPTIREIYVAEQAFQRGKMFWLQPTGQIWVVIETEPGVGIWQVYEDRFKEGDMEFDPEIVPPTGLYQPVRGFGTIWRGNPEVRDGLGWGVDAELGFVTNYEYQPSGDVVDDEFIPAPGYHFLRSVYGEWLRFNEVNGTWQEITRAEVGQTPTP